MKHTIKFLTAFFLIGFANISFAQLYDFYITQTSNYLKTITPDSLKKYDLDYSEMYIENDISTSSDPMGVKHYLVTGEIIGKESISEGDENYYPLFRIDNYRDTFLYNIFEWFIWGLLLIESYILYRLVKRKMNDA